jgi:hypothetical protein
MRGGNRLTAAGATGRAGISVIVLPRILRLIGGEIAGRSGLKLWPRGVGQEVASSRQSARGRITQERRKRRRTE